MKYMILRSKDIGIIMAACFCALFAGCQKKEAAGTAGMPIPVKYVEPQKTNVEFWDEYTARLEALAYVELRSRVEGYLEKVLFTEGQYVKKGDLLFVIDPRPYQAAFDSAKASVREVEARLSLAESNLARGKELLDSKAISKETYDTRYSEKMSAQAALLNAKARLREAELNLEFTEIRAPISGRVSEALVDPGNLISANSTLLTTIVDDSIVQAYFEISERDILDYRQKKLFDKINIKERKGPPVKMKIGSAVYDGSLTYYDNRLGSETSSLTMRADFDNSNRYISSGMFAKVEVQSMPSHEEMTLPEAIIGTDLVERYVLVVNKDDVVEYRPLKIGKLIGKDRVVYEGVKPGERVISKGIQRAVSGVKVSPSPDVPEPSENAEAK